MRFETIDWSRWQPAERATLLFVVRDGRILLMHKKTGLGAGMINGPGGRVGPGESPRDAAIRETIEELGVVPAGVADAGELLFQFTDGYSVHVFVFTASDCEGEPRETAEAAPLWTPVGAIPYEEMWEDDRLWMPLMLAGDRFRGRFLFDGFAMLGHEIERTPAPA